jgi:ribosomal protein L37AE/L43A
LFPPEAVADGLFVMPKLNTRPEDSLRANSHTEGACPDCESQFHYEISRTLARCADCGHEFKLPKRMRCAENGRVEVAA